MHQFQLLNFLMSTELFLNFFFFNFLLSWQETGYCQVFFNMSPHLPGVSICTFLLSNLSCNFIPFTIFASFGE